MSYPRTIEILIVEDDPNSKSLYDEILGELQKDYPLAPTRYGFSVTEGKAELAAEQPLHLVVLDLCLPDRPRRPAPLGDIRGGLELLDLCIARDPYPVPVALVVSAHVDKADQTTVRQRLETGFSYGQLVAKAAQDSLKQELSKAFDRVLQYGEVGVHLRDGLAKQWPTLSPREEDLLRRAVIEAQAAGLDLQWWSAEYARPSGGAGIFGGWTKVLAGRFLFRDGLGRSSRHFFKFAASAEDPVLNRDARLLSKKLSHVKFVSCRASSSRALLVTEQVGDSDKPLVSLDSFLSDGNEADIAKLVEGVARQLERLSEVHSNMLRPRDLLFDSKGRGHNADALGELATKHGLPAGDLATLEVDPVLILDRVRRSDHALHHGVRGCLHGDLNPTNIAIDRETPDGAKGYIFDASNMKPGVACNDLATLEVTTLLHVAPGSERLVPILGEYLYAGATIDLPDPPTGLSRRASNTARLIKEIRRQSIVADGPDAYALMVFDAALIQLGGLPWSRNKIAHPADAVLLARMAAGWLTRVAAPWLPPAAA